MGAVTPRSPHTTPLLASRWIEITNKRETTRQRKLNKNGRSTQGSLSRPGDPQGSMDGAGGLPIGVLRRLVRRSAMGLYRQSFRFEGGGRHVIGLNRTGKSCRLRWVNYLHPGLKRGKMTPLEERLVLELHAKWGNRWSRIARKLPGRTDNEIKNYWRTHMRKKAQEKKRANGGSSSTNAPPSPSPSSSSDHSNSNSKRSSSSSSSNITTVDSLPFHDSTTGVESFYDTGGRTDKKPAAEDAKANFYSMDDIWKAISLPEVNALANMVVDHPLYGTAETVLQGSSEIIENDAALGQFDQFYCSDSLWKMDDEASNAFFCGGFGAGETLTSGS